MTNTAPKLQVMVTQPLWLYDDKEKLLLSSLLLVCDRVLTLDLHKHCYEHDFVDKARGFFASLGHTSWCSAAWKEGLLQEPKGVDEVVLKCRDSLKDEAKTTRKVNPQELVTRVYIELSQAESASVGSQIYPVSLSGKPPQAAEHPNAVIAAHYHLARAALSVAVPSIPVLDSVEQVLELRRSCLESGELEEFQCLLRSMTAEINSHLLASDADLDLEHWASGKAETDVRLALHNLEKKISSLSSSERFAFLRNKDYLSSLVSLIHPASWVELLKNLVTNLPSLAETVEAMIDPETHTLRKNPSLAYLYRLTRNTLWAQKSTTDAQQNH